MSVVSMTKSRLHNLTWSKIAQRWQTFIWAQFWVIRYFKLLCLKGFYSANFPNVAKKNLASLVWSKTLAFKCHNCFWRDFLWSASSGRVLWPSLRLPFCIGHHVCLGHPGMPKLYLLPTFDQDKDVRSFEIIFQYQFFYFFIFEPVVFKLYFYLKTCCKLKK